MRKNWSARRAQWSRVGFLVTLSVTLTVGVVGVGTLGAVAADRRASAAQQASLEANMRALAQASSLSEDRALIHSAEAQTARAAQHTALEQSIAAATATLVAAEATLTESTGEVTDPATTDQLGAVVQAARTAATLGDTSTLLAAVPALQAAAQKATEDHAAWTPPAPAATPVHKTAPSSSGVKSPTAPSDADGSPLDLSGCLKPSGPTLESATAVVNQPCVADMEYGPSRWLASHDGFAGTHWTRIPVGGTFTFEGHTYAITDRIDLKRLSGPSATDVPTSEIVYGDLTLQTCDGPAVVFIHANIVG